MFTSIFLYEINEVQGEQYFLFLCLMLRSRILLSTLIVIFPVVISARYIPRNSNDRIE